MTCQELSGQYELYALGVLEEPERSELKTHLHRRCQVCTVEIRRASGTVAGLTGLVPLSDPPAGLRKKVLATVGAEQRGWGWVPAWIAVAACCLVLAGWFAAREKAVRRELAQSRQQVQERATELGRLSEALDIINEPGARQVVFGKGAPKPPRGNVFVNPNRGVLLLASNLPAAPAGKTYEMWVIPKSGKPVPAGLFQSDVDGNAIHISRTPVDLATTGAVAVTIEAETGAAQPTSTPLIVAAL
jgi:hypothetical protein